MSKQKGFSLIVVLAIVVVVVAGGLFLYSKMSGSPTDNMPSVPQIVESPTPSSNTGPSGENSELDDASAQLDSTQFTEIDTELGQLEYDSSW